MDVVSTYTMGEILIFGSIILGLKIPKSTKIPKIQKSQENQVSYDSMKESQAQMEGIEWFSSFS